VHQTPPQRRHNLLSPSSVMRGRFPPESPRHSSQILSEPSTPSCSSTVSTPLYHQYPPTTLTPPPSDSKPLPLRAIDNLARDFSSHPAYRTFDSAQIQTKIMEDTLHPPEGLAVHRHYAPFLGTAHYSKTSYESLQGMPDISSSLVPQPYGETETHRSESPPVDLPYCPSPCYQCHGLQTTDQGTVVVYDTFDDWNVHFLRDHVGPSRWVTKKCPWRGCTTKVTFATLKLWLDHVRIVHQKSFYCELPGCKIALGGPNPRPFGSQADLNRHGLTKSHLAPVLCDKPGCPGKENLNRLDKRTKHTLEYHGQVLCTVDGCIRGRQIGNDYYGFATNDDLMVHLRDKHHL
jgi:hypothetical protein